MTLRELMEAAQHLNWQDQVHLATRLLQWAETNMQHQTVVERYAERQPDLHPGALAMHEDFDHPLPDSFWLGEG